VGGHRSLGVCTVPQKGCRTLVSLSLSLSLSLSVSFFRFLYMFHDDCLAAGPKAKGPTGHGLKPPKCDHNKPVFGSWLSRVLVTMVGSWLNRDFLPLLLPLQFIWHPSHQALREEPPSSHVYLSPPTLKLCSTGDNGSHSFLSGDGAISLSSPVHWPTQQCPGSFGNWCLLT
jgi:hypothetical protein